MSKLFFYDLETTGTRYWKNGIHQISGAIMIDGEIKEKFNFKVKPLTTTNNHSQTTHKLLTNPSQPLTNY